VNVVISSIEHVASDVVSISLESVDGLQLPAFSPGSHIDVAVAHGIIRQYSLVNTPGKQDTYTIGVHRSATSRGGSIAAHGLRVGDKVTISAPRNQFPLVEKSKNIILIAGGIGITPMLSMAAQLFEEGRRFSLHYSARDEQRMAFRCYLESVPWRENLFLYFSEREQGRLDMSSLLADPDPESHVYVCGPQGMIDSAVTIAEAQGWLGANVHRELFGAPAYANNEDREFTVELVRSGKRIRVGRDESMAQALRRNGIPIPTSCEQGICGTCLTGLKGGVADHRDAYLTDEEKEEGTQILPCCSRALSDVLILDL
jgi:vanillate O-demethylase ferredoxin subunit